jgi:hypothetical protein
MTTSLAAWNHVVKCEFMRLAPAVLASEIVTREYFLPRETALNEGAPHAPCQPDDGRYREGRGDGVYLTPAVLDELCLAAEHHHDGPAGAAHIMGLIALIEDENWPVYHVRTPAYSSNHSQDWQPFAARTRSSRCRQSTFVMNWTNPPLAITVCPVT